jgi:hypothetical protein
VNTSEVGAITISLDSIVVEIKAYISLASLKITSSARYR